MATSCAVSAGIHTARNGGTTQMPSLVFTVITPCDAKSNWSSRWECRLITWPCSKSQEPPAISAIRRPFSLKRKEWRVRDIYCHDSESQHAGQLLFVDKQSWRRHADGWKTRWIPQHNGL